MNTTATSRPRDRAMQLDTAPEPRAVPSSQQPPMGNGDQPPCTLPTRSNALRDGDGSRSDTAGRTHPSVAVSGCARGRRQFLLTGLFSLVAGFFSGRTAAAAATAKATGEPVTTRMRQGEPPGQPLDTMLLFERGDDNNGPAITHEVLSLIHQEKGKHSYPWTMYASLETHHEMGDACVVCSRLHKHGPGWSTGLHSEVFNHGRGVALGVNIEMSSDPVGPEATEVIGLNIQAVGGSAPMQHGIQIHDSGNHFQTAIHLKGKGATGIDLPGNYQVGLNLRSNNIRLNEGACVELDGAGRIKVRYKNNRIEFLNGDRCIAHLDVNAEDHAL